MYALSRSVLSCVHICQQCYMMNHASVVLLQCTVVDGSGLTIHYRDSLINGNHTTQLTMPIKTTVVQR